MFYIVFPLPFSAPHQNDIRVFGAGEWAGGWVTFWLRNEEVSDLHMWVPVRIPASHLDPPCRVGSTWAFMTVNALNFRAELDGLTCLCSGSLLNEAAVPDSSVALEDFHMPSGGTQQNFCQPPAPRASCFLQASENMEPFGLGP